MWRKVNKISEKVFHHKSVWGKGLEKNSLWRISSSVHDSSIFSNECQLKCRLGILAVCLQPLNTGNPLCPPCFQSLTFEDIFFHQPPRLTCLWLEGQTTQTLSFSFLGFWNFCPSLVYQSDCHSPTMLLSDWEDQKLKIYFHFRI